MTPDLRGASPVRVTLVASAPPVVAVVVAALAGLDGTTAVLVVAAGAVLSAVLVMALVVRPLLAQLARARLSANDLHGELAAERAGRELRDRLDRALGATESEAASLRTGLRAVAEVVPDAEVSLLLSVPDEPRIGWRSRLVDANLLPAEAVSGNPACRALATGAVAATPTSHALDACSHLGGPDDEVSGVCLPLRIGDRLLGVVSLVGAPGEEPDGPTLRTLEWVVDRTAERVTEQRRSRGPATTGPEDPVTLLPGVPALRHHLRELVRALTPFSVAVVTLDGADDLRERHGADDVDDALRLTAEALTATLRPDDVVCRLDGPRFAAVLVQCDREQAAAALERVREALVLSIAVEDVPHFTCSAGIVESHRATSLEEIVRMADAACLAAHLQGGNRVATAD